MVGAITFEIEEHTSELQSRTTISYDTHRIPVSEEVGRCTSVLRLVHRILVNIDAESTLDSPSEFDSTSHDY